MGALRELLKEFTPSWMIQPTGFAEDSASRDPVQPDDRAAAERLARDADVAWEDCIENERMDPRKALRAARRN